MITAVSVYLVIMATLLGLISGSSKETGPGLFFCILSFASGLLALAAFGAFGGSS